MLVINMQVSLVNWLYLYNKYKSCILFYVIQVFNSAKRKIFVASPLG